MYRLNKTKHKKLTDKSFVKFILPSILGIIFCMVSLLGMTWAWFTASVTTPTQAIQTASYHTDVLVINATQNPDDSFTLESNTEYTITLTANGSASTGYVVVAFNDTALFVTDQIDQGNSLSFTFIPDDSGDYSFISVWGVYLGEADISDGDTIGAIVP